MKSDEILVAIRHSKDLPTLSEFYIKFKEKMADPDISATEIANLISSDPPIASKILRMANSPFYGLVSRITTIPHAIVVIGFNGINYLILNTAVLNLFSKSAGAASVFDISQLWRHSSATAIISRLIAKKINYPAHEEMFTAGLLHDIGKLYVYRNYPKDFEAIINLTKSENLYIREAETKILGLDHAQIGGVLIQEWKLPEILLITTSLHHNPILAKDKSRPANIVNLANLICHALEIGHSGNEKIPPLDKECWESLGLSTDGLEDIVKGIDEELEHFDLMSA